jgi:hypothetical protein
MIGYLMRETLICQASRARTDQGLQGIDIIDNQIEVNSQSNSRCELGREVLRGLLPVHGEQLNATDSAPDLVMV